MVTVDWLDLMPHNASLVSTPAVATFGTVSLINFKLWERLAHVLLTKLSKIIGRTCKLSFKMDFCWFCFESAILFYSCSKQEKTTTIASMIIFEIHLLSCEKLDNSPMTQHQML